MEKSTYKAFQKKKKEDFTRKLIGDDDRTNL